VRRAGRVAALLLACAAPARAQDDPLARLSGARAKEIATELASDAMEGRKTGFPGGKRAEERVAAFFEEAGLLPAGEGGGWFHEFLFSTSQVAPPIALSVGGEPVEYGPGFVDLVHTGEATVEAEVVFVGYGISAPDRAWDDYDGVDVKGKVALAVRGVPSAREGDFGPERLIGWKSSLARDRGAVGFLIVEGKNPVPGTIQEKYHRADLPAVWVSEAVADRILAPRGRTLSDLKRQRDGGDPGRSFATSKFVRLEVHGRLLGDARGRNVLARLEGSDPELSREAVLVGGHLDHLGLDPLGRVFNGADDNASGTAVVLHLAETLAKGGWKPRRTVFFCGFAAEEQGLVGARRLAQEMPFGEKTLVAMVNVDMAGQGKPAVALAGMESYPATRAFLRSRLGEEPWKALAFPRAAENSDHWPFLERGIPAIFAMTQGDHPNYHQLADDAANLQSECLEAAARGVGRVVRSLADEPTPLAGREGLEERLLHEGARVVEGPASAAALREIVPGAPPSLGPGVFERAAAAGWTAVVVPVDEESDGAVVALARLQSAAGRVRDRLALASSASDLANAARAGRLALLPRLACPRSVTAFPGVLSAYRALGVRYVAPFPPSSPPGPEEMGAVLDAAVAAALVVDLTGLPPESLARARARLKDAPAVVSLPGVDAGTEPGAAKVLEVRRALGSPGLVVVDPSATLLARVARGDTDPPALASLVLATDDTDRLRAMLREAIASVGPAIREPDHPGRARLRSLLGGAWVDVFRRAQ
jgi:hypothetical protein